MRIQSNTSIWGVPFRGLRTWLTALGIFFLTSTWLAQSKSDENRPISYFEGFETTPGQPYDLLGRRIYFTSWQFVAPGDLSYKDKDGNIVYARNDVKAGPWDAKHIAIQQPWGIELHSEKAEHVGPVLQPEYPWEEMGVNFYQIIRDGNIYRGYGRSQGADGEEFRSYYESQDGIHWERPRLGLVEYLGSRENNLLPEPSPESVFIDPHAPPGERYKAIYHPPLNREQFNAFRKKRSDGWEPRALLHWKENDPIYICGLGGMVSPDGIHWKPLKDPLVVEYSDTLVTCYYDLLLERYVMYTRQWWAGTRSRRLPADIRSSWTGHGRRAIGRSESVSFQSFPPSETIVEPPPSFKPTESLYTNCFTQLPDAPEQFLMFPSIYDIATDNTRIGLLSSHDGIVWNWIPGGDVFETQTYGQWNGGNIWAVPNLVETPQGDFILPYEAYNVPHKYPRGGWTFYGGLARWPHGRVVALEAKEKGEFWTVQFVPRQKPVRLRINAVTEQCGAIKIGIIGQDGKDVDDCGLLAGDMIWAPVTWKGIEDPGIDKDQPVQLHIQLEYAKLYGLQWDEE